jgi:hypothetical protein
MKQDVGGFDGGPSGVEILGVGVFDDDLSAGGRITDLRMDPQHDQEWSGEVTVQAHDLHVVHPWVPFCYE